MKESTTQKVNVRNKRTKQVCNAMRRAQIAAARKAVEFGQLLYMTRKGKVVGVDPYKVLRLAEEEG
jgi:3'-phosphoadenosine 5'-phosphosulfate sulfotransferase